MLKYLQRVKSVKKFAKMTACILLISACDEPSRTSNVPPLTEPQQEHHLLKRAIYAEQFQLDPHKLKNAADSAPIRDLLVGLVAYDRKGKIVPAIAQNWFTEDNQNWLFILDDNAKWSNNEPVTAYDFVASWQRLIEPENQSPLAHYLVDMGVENAKAILHKQKMASELGVEALNNHTLQIRLVQPTPLLPKMLSHTALLPTYQGKVPQKEHFISNAAYKISQLAPKKMDLLARAHNVPFQNVQYELLAQSQDSNLFDLVENPFSAQTSNIIKLPRLCSYYYEFNFNSPQLSKKEVREALRAMVRSSNIGQEYGMLSQSVLPHHLINVRETQWSPVVIEQLLTQVGITAHNPLKLTLLYDEDTLNSEIANKMTRALSQSELFNISLEMVDAEKFRQLKTVQHYQLIRSGWCADYSDPIPFLQKFHSKSQDNYSGYTNELVDQKLERLQAENLSQEERGILLQEINEQLYQDVAVLPLFQYQHPIQVDSSLWGIDLNNDSQVIYSKDLHRISQTKD